MDEPPRELDGAKVLRYAVVTPNVKPTRATRHSVGGAGFEPAAALAIARYPTDEVGSRYLLYLDQDGTVVTDTWHASLDDALDQAAFEYEGLSWTDVADS